MQQRRTTTEIDVLSTVPGATILSSRKGVFPKIGMLKINCRIIAKQAAPMLIGLLLLNLPGEAQSIIRPHILNITNKLQKDGQLHLGYPVGFAGKPEAGNKYYKLYKRLKAKATEQELVALTKMKSALLVVYAFDILQEREHEGSKNIFIDHVKDTAWIWIAGGCTGFASRVNWFMLRRLKPIEGARTNVLTKAEFDIYCYRFKDEDELFSCN